MPWIAQLTALVEAQAAPLQWVHRASRGVKARLYLEADACYPFKQMVRHGLALLAETDALLLPRIVGLDGYLTCPNFRALPDIVRLNCERAGLAAAGPVIAPVMDVGSLNDVQRVAIAITSELGLPAAGATARQPAAPPQKISAATQAPAPVCGPNTIAVLGHPYMAAEPSLNNGVTEILHGYGYETITAQDLPFAELDRLASEYDYYAKKLYWRSAREILGAFLYWTRHERPAGIVHLVPFNCGVDALLRVELGSLYQQMQNAPPFMVIVCDEHTQRDHVVTRIEAFLDIVDGIRIR
jgi:predicted nucleotide-binding protein (sugar kinase/HSP70/actin superfamily)